MPETMNLLETALENEAKLFLKLINALENDDLYDLIRRLAELSPAAGRDPTEEILNVVQNVKHIDAALDNFYVS